MGAEQSSIQRSKAAPTQTPPPDFSTPQSEPEMSSFASNSAPAVATATDAEQQIPQLVTEPTQITPAPIATVTPTTTTTSTTNMDPAVDMSVDEVPYPFREKVKNLSLEERKERYEEEIRRLFENPHPTHVQRLMPEKIVTEKADVVNLPNSSVSWNSIQTTYDIGKGALNQRSFKRCNRSKADPWRRYGALRKLHEIGGTGCLPPNQGGLRFQQQKFYTIAAGSPPPPPPPNPPITTIEEYGSPESLLAPRKRKPKQISEKRK
ncbi:unnamed protein product [Cylicocyclus nassatus]|uniref:Uncharacterized protein n=1 Tax=Cylicocyclus nassatus TaxID=53992 RepID=A0AA36M989_CYLNA|nr:unnamed protein product [Cylicocyclus nassatus]